MTLDTSENTISDINQDSEATATTQICEHEYALLFPTLAEHDFKSLVNDIKANGLKEPIKLFEDKILDGRHRYRACIAAGVEPRFESVNGTSEEALSYVFSLNLYRRQLDQSQKALVAARLANLRKADPSITKDWIPCPPRPIPSKTTSSKNRFLELLEHQNKFNDSDLGRSAAFESGVCLTQNAAAEQMNVSWRQVQYAAAALEGGTPELIKAIEAGNVKVYNGAVLSKLPARDQLNLLKRNPTEIAEACKKIRKERHKCAPKKPEIEKMNIDVNKIVIKFTDRELSELQSLMGLGERAPAFIKKLIKKFHNDRGRSTSERELANVELLSREILPMKQKIYNVWNREVQDKLIHSLLSDDEALLMH